MLNNIFLQGNLTADVDVKENSKGKFSVFAVAHNYGKNEKKVTTFVSCFAGGKTGEIIAKYFSKGKPIIVEGSLRQGKSNLYISVNSFHFCGPKSEEKKADKPIESNGDENGFPF